LIWTERRRTTKSISIITTKVKRATVIMRERSAYRKRWKRNLMTIY
jgi:hypothetical protein